jgi:hypothetical protein
VHWGLWLAWTAIVAAGVGLFGRRYGWAAAFAAYVIGIALWVTIELRPPPPWAATDVWGWEQWRDFVLTKIPIGVGAAIFGWVGNHVRSRRSAGASPNPI